MGPARGSEHEPRPWRVGGRAGRLFRFMIIIVVTFLRRLADKLHCIPGACVGETLYAGIRVTRGVRRPPRVREPLHPRTSSLPTSLPASPPQHRKDRISISPDALAELPAPLPVALSNPSALRAQPKSI